MKKFLFIHFEPEDEEIKIKGTKIKIKKFSKENKEGEYEELQLYALINDFNQNQTSAKSIELSSEFMELIQKYPSVIFNPSILNKTKKISMSKALNLDNNDFYKQDKYTQSTINKIFCWFITLCAEVYWGIKADNSDSDDVANFEECKDKGLKIEFVNFIESVFSFKARK